MKNGLIFTYLLILLGSCSLSADQEKKLNESLSAYLNARNECQLINYVAFTHPGLVAYYKTQGDSVFKKEFDCHDDTLYLQDPTVRQIKSTGMNIHVEYDLDVYSEFTGEKLEKKQIIYAISVDKGNSWFFMDQQIYVDKKILPKFKRLLMD